MEMPAWLERAAPSELGVFLGKTASPRKSGLFIRHLCRCFPEVFVDPRSLAALDAADRYEAGEIGHNGFEAARRAAEEALLHARAEYNPMAPDPLADATRTARTVPANGDAADARRLGGRSTSPSMSMTSSTTRGAAGSFRGAPLHRNSRTEM